MLGDIIRLLYPRLCVACHTSLLKSEEFLCSSCLLNLPYTHFHLEAGNALEKNFWGRVPVQAATSLFFFRSGGSVQKILHSLKYNENKELAEYLGKLLGQSIRKWIDEKKIESVVAVPLHKSKLRKRGYNQSEYFANGLAQTLGLENVCHAVKRTKATETQTKKSRTERIDNVERIFELSDPPSVQGKHLLLVDDVITTGATIEACAEILLQEPDTKLSIASIAVAM